MGRVLVAVPVLQDELEMPTEPDMPAKTSPTATATASAPQAVPDSAARWRRLLRIVRITATHPVFPVVAFILASTFLYKIDPASRGEFYPFSNFPMYANPRDRDLEYYFIVDGDDNPVAVHHHTGFTAARVKKLMRSQLQRWARDNGRKWNKKSAWLTDEVQSEAAREVLVYLRRRSHALGKPLPETIAMMRGTIFVDANRQLGESFSRLAVDRAESDAEAAPDDEGEGIQAPEDA